MNEHNTDKWPGDGAGEQPAGDIDGGTAALLPMAEVREFELPDSVTDVSLCAAATFAESLRETQGWVGDAIEVSIDHGLILRNAHKVVGAMMAHADFVPVTDKNFASREAALTYASLEEKPVTFYRSRGGDCRIGRIGWRLDHPVEKIGTR